MEAIDIAVGSLVQSIHKEEGQDDQYLPDLF